MRQMGRNQCGRGQGFGRGRSARGNGGNDDRTMGCQRRNDADVGFDRGGRGMGRNRAAFDENAVSSPPSGSAYAGQGGNGQGQGGMRRRRRDGSCLGEQAG